MALPVDPERLRRQFPDLTDEDLDAYVAVTRRVLADPAARGRILTAVLRAGQAATEKAASGAALDTEEDLALRYLRAMGKMQAPVATRAGGERP